VGALVRGAGCDDAPVARIYQREDDYMSNDYFPVGSGFYQNKIAEQLRGQTAPPPPPQPILCNILLRLNMAVDFSDGISSRAESTAIRFLGEAPVAELANPIGCPPQDIASALGDACDRLRCKLDAIERQIARLETLA
jgi:hypothetical protein